MTQEAVRDRKFTDLEIRILNLQSDGYPVEITLDNAREFPRGYLATEFLPWVASSDPVADGHALFGWLLSDERLRRAWAETRGRNLQRRIRLRIDATAPELHAIPWELLCDSESGSLNQMLTAGEKTPFSRYLAGQWDPGEPITTRPIKLLVAIANPQGLDEYGLSEIDVKHEKSIMLEAISDIPDDQIEIHFLDEEVNLQRLSVKLKKGVHILHLVSHGTFNVKKATAALYLADEDDDVRLTKVNEFSDMLGRLAQPPQMVYLSSCQTATRSPADAFRGFAPALIAAGVPTVLAMQDLVPVPTAQAFASTFYRQLLEHGIVDLAANEARSALLNADLSGGSIPVLFSRLPGNRLFAQAPVSDEKHGPKIQPPPEPSPLPNTDHCVGRKTELKEYARDVQQTGAAVIGGMIGVGKTSLAAMLARKIDRPDKTLWHTFGSGNGLDALLWKLAGFLYWNDQPDLWAMLQGVSQGGGSPPPAGVLYEYALQMLPGRGYLLCLDNLDAVEDDPQLRMLVDRLRPIMATGDISLIITTQRAPDYFRAVEPLAGLSYADTETLLFSRRVTLDEDLIHSLHDSTNGNAELLTIALDAISRAPDPAKLIARLTNVRDIQNHLLNELDRGLNDEERRIQGAISVLGKPSERDAIEMTLDADNLHRTLHELSERYFLTIHEQEWVREYGQHTVLQSFYYDYLGRRARREMHVRAAEYFTQDAFNPVRAAYHHQLAGNFQQAAQIATDHVAWAISQFQARSMMQILAQFEAAQLSSEAWIKCNLALGELHAFLGDRPGAQAGYDIAWSQLENAVDLPNACELSVQTCRGLGQLLYNEQPREALVWLERGRAELARCSAEEQHVSEAELHIDEGWAHIRLNQFGNAEEALKTGLAGLPPGPSALRGDALGRLASLYTARLDLQNARHFAALAVENSQVVHDPWQELNLLAMLATTDSLACNWPGAIENYEEARQLAIRLGNQPVQAALDINIGIAHYNLGDAESAALALDRGLELAQQRDLKLFALKAEIPLGKLSIRLGDWASAGVHLSRAEELVGAIGTKEAEFYLPLILSARAELLLAEKEYEAALKWADSSISLAIEQRKNVDLAICRRILGKVLYNMGRYAGAEEALAQSLQVLEGRNAYEAAKARADHGRTLIAINERARGEALLAQATTELQTWGAAFDLAELADYDKTQPSQ